MYIYTHIFIIIIITIHIIIIQGAGLRDLDLGGEVPRQVLVHDAVRGGEEGQDVLDEVPVDNGLTYLYVYIYVCIYIYIYIHTHTYI